MRGLKHDSYFRSREQYLSHLLQMRGLKHPLNVTLPIRKVASFTDAWIETAVMARLKDACLVASFTDAWIETPLLSKSTLNALVASFTDAWIETPGDVVSNLDPRRIFYRCVD